MADIQIKGRMVNAIRIILKTNDHDLIQKELAQLLEKAAPQGALAVIESTVEQELISLIQLLISLDLQPIAITDGILTPQAQAIQFPILPPDRKMQVVQATQEQVAAINIEPTEEQSIELAPRVNSYHNEILRTGQSLTQKNGDIVINATINNGSEVIASGSIHIYGITRGRVIAGANGDHTARIFCHNLEAELVSIAGTYCVADDIPAEFLKKPVQIYLNDQAELVFEALQF